MFTKTTTIVTMLAAVSLSSAANADVFTDLASFDSSNPGLTTIDFEGIAAPGSFTGSTDNFFTALGVDLSTPDPTSNTVVGSSGGAFSFSSAALTSNAFATGIQIDFTDAVSSVGFNVAVMGFALFAPGSVEIEVFSGGSLLASESFMTSTFADFSSFIGFSGFGTDITSIQITPIGGAFTQLAIDNLSFGTVQVVPLPTAALAGLGLLGSLGVYRRIKR